jgi:hypothetical protein
MFYDIWAARAGLVFKACSSGALLRWLPARLKAISNLQANCTHADYRPMTSSDLLTFDRERARLAGRVA